MPRPEATGPFEPAAAAGLRLPVRGLGGGLHDRSQSRIAKMAQPILNRIRLRRGRELVHHAFVREGVLQPIGRA